MSKRIKGKIKYAFELVKEQEEAFKGIKENQVTIITGDAGSGKSSLAAISTLDMLFRREINKVYISRSIEEVGRPMGFLPGLAQEKFEPFIEPFMDSLYRSYKHREVIDKLVEKNTFEGAPVQFIRGKNIERKELLVLEESQNYNKHEMLALLTRLTPRGKIIILGDNNQTDTNQVFTGLSYVIELSKHIKGIKQFNLIENHRSGIVREILEYERRNKNK